MSLHYALVELVSPHHPDLITFAANGSQPPYRTLSNFWKYIFFQDITSYGIFLFPVGVELAAQVQTSQLYPHAWPVH
eukprot:622510-Ditylum_brightwellii.AAC.1